MAFEKNLNEMKLLFLVLIGIPLIASTNIDCSGKSFHCLNSTHFMICVDLGGGASYTVDDFVIPCPPPTECKASNRFECELPPSTTLAPMTTSPVTTATFTKQKETTVEDVIVDTISWNTGPEQHLELSSVATQEPTIETTVIPLQPVTTSDLPEKILNGTESSIVTNSGVNTLTTVSDQGTINIDIESATDIFLVTPGNTTTSIDSRFIVTSDIINENITNSANEKGTEMFSEVVTTTEIVNVYKTGLVNNTDVHLNVTVQHDFVSVATPENAILDSNEPVQITPGLLLTERSAPTTESAWLNDNEKLSEIITTTETVINETTVTNNIEFEVNVTGSVNNVDVHSNVTEQLDHVFVSTPENVILDSNALLQSTSGLSLTESSAPTTVPAWLNDNEWLSEVISTTETNNIGFEVNVPGSVKNVDVHSNVTEQQDHVSVATPKNDILNSNVPVQSSSGLSLTERSAPATESAWLNKKKFTETVSNETKMTNNIGFEVNLTGSVNNVDVHSNVMEQQDHVSVAAHENVILDSNVPVQSTSGLSLTERSAPTTVSAWLNDSEKLSEVISTTETVLDETTVTKIKGFELNETGSANNVDVHSNVMEQQDHVSVASPENFIFDSNVPVQSSSGLSLTERSAPTTESAWLNDKNFTETVNNETTVTDNIGFEVNLTGSVNNVDVHSNVMEQQDHVSVAAHENVILDSNVPVQSTSGLSLTERSAPTTESAWLNDKEFTETVINETTVTNNIEFEVNVTGSVNNVDVHSNVTEQLDHVFVATPENVIHDSNAPLQSTSGLSLTERSAPTTVSAWLDDSEKLSNVISTTETVLDETTVTNIKGFELNETGSANNVDVHSNVMEQQDHVSVASPENFIFDSNVPVQSSSGLSLTERSAPTTESAWLNDKNFTETVNNETTVTDNIGFEVNLTGSVNNVDVHSNVMEQQDHVSVAAHENVILDSNVPVQSTSGLSLTERSAPTTVSAWLNDSEKLSEVISTTETNNIGFEVNETGSVNNVDSNVTQQKDHVSVATPENDILDSNVPVQSKLGLSLTERSAPTAEFARPNDIQNLMEVITTSETVIDETTVTNIGLEMNKTGSLSNTDVHPNGTVQQDYVFVNTSVNDISVSNVPVEFTAGLSFIERSAPITESARLNDTSNFTNYDTLVTGHTIVASTDVQPFSTVVTTVKSNTVGSEIGKENFTASASSYNTTESIKSGNESVFLANESNLNSAANVNSVPIQENRTSVLILAKNITARSENTTNDFVMTRTQIKNLHTKLNKNTSDTLFTEASETTKNVRSETSTFYNTVYVNQYSENSTVSPIAERNQIVTEVPTRLSTASNYIQNDTTVDIGTTLSTKSMRSSVSKLGSNEKENAIVIANSIYNSSDATVQNTGIKEDSALNEQNDVVSPSLYTTPLPHENKYFFIESSNSNFNNKVKDIGTDLTLSTESIKSNQEVANGFAVVTESEFTTVAVNSDTQSELSEKSIPATSSLLDVNTENIINTKINVPSTVLTATAESTNEVNLVNNPAYRIENEDSVYNRTKKQEEKEIITTENIISSFVPVTTSTSDGLVSSNLEADDENYATIFDDTRLIVNILVNGSYTTTTEINILAEEKQTIEAPRSETGNIVALLPKDENGTSDSTTEKNNASNLYQQKDEQVLLFADTYKIQNITRDPSTEEINTKSTLKNSVVQKSMSLPSTGQSIDMSKQSLLASISEKSTDIDQIENREVQKSTAFNIEQSNTITTQLVSPVSTEQGINMNTLLNSVVGQKMATTPSSDHNKIINTMQNGVVQQISTTPSTGQSNNMKTPLDKDKINQSLSVLSTTQSNIIDIIQNGEVELITSASNTEQNTKLEPTTWTPSTERNYVITTIQKQQKGGNEQIMSVPRTEQTSIFITTQNSGLEEVMSGPSSTKQSKTVISPTNYGFEQTISVSNTEENTAQNAVIGQTTAPSGTGQSHILNTLLNDDEQATSTFIVKQNNTLSIVQNSGVDQIIALFSTEKNKLVTGDNTVKYSGVDQIESVIGIEQSNHKIKDQYSIVKEAASDFYMEKNNTLTAKSYVSQNYLESSTSTNPLTNSKSVLNDYSNLQQRAVDTNAYESDVTEHIRLSSTSSQDTGSSVVQVSKLEETFSKSATNSQKSTNTPEQTTEIQMNDIRYTDSSNNIKQNGTKNIKQNVGVVETGPLNFLEKDSDNKKADLKTKLVRDTVPTATLDGGGHSEYFLGTTTADVLNGPNIMGTHTLLLTALPYKNTATGTTEFSKNNEPLVTLSASTSATTLKPILEREESEYTIASNLTFLLGKTTPDVVESDQNTVQSHVENSRSVLLENPIEINTQAYVDNSNSALVSKMIFTEKHVVAATASTTTATKLSDESQQSSKVNATVAEKDKISQDGIVQQSNFENLPFAVTSKPLEKKHIDNGLTVNSTSSFMEDIQTTRIPLVVEVTTKLTATGTSAASEQESNSTYKPFDCQSRSSGKYADNNDCSKFYICSGTAQLIIGKCPNNTVFSEIRKQCTRNLSHCIRNNEFKCMNSGRFADYLKPNVYYICVKKQQTFLRYKLQCQEGYLLNRLTMTCYKNVAPVSESVSSDNSQNTTEKISKEKKTVKINKNSNKNKDFECDDEGKFPNPYDCRGYYICKLKNKSDETYYRKYKKCDEDEVFHKEKKKCVDASSYECRYCDSLSLNVYYVRVTRGHHFIKYKLECQEDHYLNAAEVRCDKILKATNTKEISKNTSQESINSNRHNHKNKPRFKCQEEGQFVDPNDCRKYYICREEKNSEQSDSEQRYRRKHRKCSKHEVYNAEIQACAYSRNMSCLYNN